MTTLKTPTLLVILAILVACMLCVQHRLPMFYDVGVAVVSCKRQGRPLSGHTVYHDMPLKRGLPSSKENEVLFATPTIEPKNINDETVSTSSCSAMSCDNGSGVDILDPKFNIRECVKNMLLLEQHLFVPEQACVQCIRKHAMLIEAFIDEAYSLDTAHKYDDVLSSTKRTFEPIMTRLEKLDTSSARPTFVTLGQDIRAIRKPLMPHAVSLN